MADVFNKALAAVAERHKIPEEKIKKTLPWLQPLMEEKK
jgi:hypothetical protein